MKTCTTSQIHSLQMSIANITADKVTKCSQSSFCASHPKHYIGLFDLIRHHFIAIYYLMITVYPSKYQIYHNAQYFLTNNGVAKLFNSICAPMVSLVATPRYHRLLQLNFSIIVTSAPMNTAVATPRCHSDLPLLSHLWFRKRRKRITCACNKNKCLPLPLCAPAHQEAM